MTLPIIVYAAAFIVVILHFTKYWANRNMEWVVLVTAAVVLVVNVLDYMKIL